MGDGSDRRGMWAPLPPISAGTNRGEHYQKGMGAQECETKGGNDQLESLEAGQGIGRGGVEMMDG